MRIIDKSALGIFFGVMVLAVFLIFTVSCGQNEVKSTIEQVRRLLDQGRIHSALEMLEGLLKDEPSNRQLLSVRAKARERAYDLDGALDDYNSIVDVDPDNPEILELRGKIKIKLRDFDGAEEDLELANQKKPDSPSIISSLGLAHFYKAEFEEARRLFDLGASLDERHDGPYFGRAAIYVEENDYQSAIEEMNKLLKISPKNAQALLRRGFSYLKNSDPNKALIDFDKALEYDPDLKEIYWYRAEAYRCLNEPKMALKDYEKAEQVDPDDSILFLNQGSMLIMMGRYNEALEKLR